MGKLRVRTDVMVPRLVLLSRKNVKDFDLPTAVDVPDRGKGTRRTLRKSRVNPTCNGREWIELPDDDDSSDLVLVSLAPVDLASGAKCLLAVLWMRGDTRGSARAEVQDLCDAMQAAGTIRKDWKCVWVVDHWEVQRLDTDVSVPAVAIKPVLTAMQWRVRLPGDAIGNPFAVPPILPSPPTGQFCIGESL